MYDIDKKKCIVKLKNFMKLKDSDIINENDVRVFNDRVKMFGFITTINSCYYKDNDYTKHVIHLGDGKRKIDEFWNGRYVKK